MNSLDFYAYLLGFNKQPGEYTKEEIVEIGIKYKQLPKAEKSWETLAKTIGWDGTGESLRGFVNSRIRQLNKANGIIPEETEEITNADTNAEERQLLYKAKQQVRDEWTAYRRLLREDARIDTFKDLFREIVHQLEPLNEFKSVETTKITGHAEGVLLLSDLHIGVECNNFYNQYNLSVAQKRMSKLVSEVIQYCKTFGITKLNICNLGDMIHGIIHTNARIEAEFDVVSQIMYASELISKFINELLATNITIVYRSVIDNHSRACADKKEIIEKEYFSKLIDWYLMERLKDTRVIFATDNIDESMGKFRLENGKKVMFAHGHLDDVNQAYQHFVGATREFIDYILLGHYHCEKAKSYQGAKVIVNGSIVGTEQYALSKRLFSDPSQTLLVFDYIEGSDDMINISIGL